jgi:general secretion pathway protein N
MSFTDPRAWIWAAWGVVSISLATVTGHELGWGEHIRLDLPSSTVASPAKVEDMALPDFLLDPLEKAYTETVDRPLFVPTRRPAPPPPPPEPPKPTMRKGQFVLMGVVITPETSLALLREANGTVTKRVEKGKKIDGITLEEVEPEKVVLTQHGDREVLGLKVQPSPKGAPATTAGTPAVAGAASLGIPGTTPERAARSGAEAGGSGIESLRQRARDLQERRRAARERRQQSR